VPPGADQSIDICFHQDLQHRLARARRKSLFPLFRSSFVSAILSSVMGSSGTGGWPSQIHRSSTLPVTTFRSCARRAPSNRVFPPARAYRRISTKSKDANSRTHCAQSSHKDLAVVGVVAQIAVLAAAPAHWCQPFASGRGEFHRGLAGLIRLRMLGGAGVPPGVCNRSWRRPLVAAVRGSRHCTMGTPDLNKGHLERELTHSSSGQLSMWSERSP